MMAHCWCPRTPTAPSGGSRIRLRPAKSFADMVHRRYLEPHELLWSKPDSVVGGLNMRRREFLGLVGGAAAGVPLAVAAQQPERVRRIGVLMGTEENEPEGQSRIAAFREGLRELG